MSRLVGASADRIGVVHLGAGAFARAHTWWATALAADAEPGPWGVLAVGQRSRGVVDALRSRRWAYRVRLTSADRDSVDTVQVVRDALVAADDPDALVAALGDPSVRVVTVTGTEAAYPARDGGLDAAHPGIAAEISGERGGGTVVGQIVLAAQRRLRDGAPPLSVLVCDNVARGGTLLRGLAVSLAERRGLHDTAAAARDTWAFPNTVVDRVVPAVDPADEPDVVADPVFRWVIEDRFAGPRPAWEAAGAVLTSDSGPWELAKLGLVNAPHSLAAYLGLARGHDTVREAMSDPVVRGGVESALHTELAPAVPSAPGLDAAEEARGAVRRFTQQVVPHALRQVGAEGSTKLPQRLRRPIERRRSGEAPSVRRSTLAVALWAYAVTAGTVHDRNAASVVEAVRTPAPARRATALLQVLGMDAGADDPVAARLAGWLEQLAARAGDGHPIRLQGADIHGTD